MSMDVGTPVGDAIGAKADVVGRQGGSMMKMVGAALLAGTMLNMLQDTTPKGSMHIGDSFVSAVGARMDMVARPGSAMLDMVRSVFAPPIVLGSILEMSQPAASPEKPGQDGVQTARRSTFSAPKM